MDIACPACHATLAPLQHEGIPTLSCPAGHGLFVTQEQMLAMVRSRAEDRSEAEEDSAIGAEGPQQAPGEAARQCPVCGAVMQKLVYAYDSGVTIDSCTEHGIWLDQGELARIEAWVEGSERVAAGERAQWAPRLAQVEHQVDGRLAAASGTVGGLLGGVLESVSLWNLRRDDADRR